MDQRPATQLKELRDSQLYSWATLNREAYLKRIAFLFTGSFCLLGGPIAYQTFDPSRQTAEFLLSGALGAGFVVSLAVIRIYLGWSYVGNRLLSAAVAYEETGWYDGQTFVKPPEVLTRDRLLGTYEVKPTLARLKATLLGTGSSLLVSAVLLIGLINSQADADGMVGRGAAAPRLLPGGEGILYSKSVKNLADLKSDDEAAAAEAAAQGGRPGYCGDRFFRAAAGGSFCNKFDSRGGGR
ncbi:g4353 [Coccomyxa viridis]|uniref:G4353 protein n=1 Tax=Coccomyxa viridis TaxID=1274662 RepID=A0ABP1FQ57_9CHLO